MIAGLGNRSILRKVMQEAMYMIAKETEAGDLKGTPEGCESSYMHLMSPAEGSKRVAC
jgi:hypothetical protein